MGLFSIVFSLCVVYMAYRGARNGLVKSSIRLLSLLGAYLLAYLYLGDLKQLISREFQITGLFSYILAGFSILFVGGFLLSAIFSLIWKLIGRKPKAVVDSKEVSGLSWAGMAVGAGFGGIMGLLLIWVLAMLSVHFPVLTPSESKAQDQQLHTASNQLVSKIIGGVIQAKGSTLEEQPLLQAIVQDPVTNVQRLRSISKRDSFKTLLNDHSSRQQLKQGQSKALLNNPHFKQLMKEPEVQGFMKDAGMLPQGEQGQEQFASTVTNAWQRAEKLREDPKIKAILSDPAVQKQLQQKDYFALLSNPKFGEILEAFQGAGIDKSSVINQSSAVSQSADSSLPQTVQVAEKAQVSSEVGEQLKADSKDKTQVYHWVDENGKHHYSDKKPR